jgi:RNA polymerase sigma factor (sigma-70 family)
MTGTTFSEHDSEASRHVHQAVRGSDSSLAWLVERFTPALLLQAERRMGDTLRRHVEPTDLVDDVWLVAIRRMPDLHPVEGRAVRVLMRFLGTVLLRHIRDVYEKLLRRAALGSALDRVGKDAQSSIERLSQISSSATGSVSGLIRAERLAAIRAAIDELDPLEREIVTSRAIEGASAADVAAELELTPNHLGVTLHRAIRKIRERLPDSVFDDLDGE